MVESPHMRVETEKLVGELERKFGQLGTRVLLFDLDDTLLQTSEHIDEKRLGFCSWVAGRLGLELEVVTRVFDEAAHETYDILHVAVARWEAAVRVTSERLTGRSNDLDEALPLLHDIFLGAPKIIPGVIETLSIFKSTGVKMGLVTHAPTTPPWDKWTGLKLTTHGLDRFFDQVWIADEKARKGKSDWEGMARLMEVECSRVMGFGDNVGADVIPMHELGMRVMAVKPVFGRSKGELPVGVPLLDSIVEAPRQVLLMD